MKYPEKTKMVTRSGTTYIKIRHKGQFWWFIDGDETKMGIKLPDDQLEGYWMTQNATFVQPNNSKENED